MSDQISLFAPSPEELAIEFVRERADGAVERGWSSREAFLRDLFSGYQGGSWNRGGGVSVYACSPAGIRLTMEDGTVYDVPKKKILKEVG